MRNFKTIAVILAVSATLGTIARAAFDIPWRTIDGGGAQGLTGGGFELAGTIGQCDAGPLTGTMSGGGWQMAGGFWPGVTQATCSCLADLNHDNLINGRDVQRFVGCMTSGLGDCSCADMNDSGGVTTIDLPLFVQALTSGATCP